VKGGDQILVYVCNFRRLCLRLRLLRRVCQVGGCLLLTTKSDEPGGLESSG
jgi:hypothetical protein